MTDIGKLQYVCAYSTAIAVVKVWRYVSVTTNTSPAQKSGFAYGNRSLFKDLAMALAFPYCFIPIIHFSLCAEFLRNTLMLYLIAAIRWQSWHSQNNGHC